MKRFFVVTGVMGILLLLGGGKLAYGEAKSSSGVVNQKDGAEMVLIPAGEFMMGGNDLYNDERPQHKVNLKAFYIDKYEVTNAQYQKFVQETGHRLPRNQVDPRYEFWGADGKFPPEVANQPVLNVSWDDAAAYAKWAGKRLPTEAEWEKAARGTDQRRYPWGNELPDEKKATFEKIWQGVKTLAAVSDLSAGASPYGVFNMAGNAAEWVADYYDANYYEVSPVDNPQGPASGFYRVIRGGCFCDPEFYLRCTDRDFNMPDDRHKCVGFRCAKDK